MRRWKIKRSTALLLSVVMLVSSLYLSGFSVLGKSVSGNVAETELSSEETSLENTGISEEENLAEETATGEAGVEDTESLSEEETGSEDFSWITETEESGGKEEESPGGSVEESAEEVNPAELSGESLIEEEVKSEEEEPVVVQQDNRLFDTYTWRQTTEERKIYYVDRETWESRDTSNPEVIGALWCGETLEEILQMCEDPSVEVDLDSFFKMTPFYGMGYEDLLRLYQEGRSLEEYYSGMTLEQVAEAYEKGAEKKISLFAPSSGFYGAKMQILATYRGNSAVGGSGNFYEMTYNGAPALCVQHKTNAPEGMYELVGESSDIYAKKAMKYLESHGGDKRWLFAAQVYVWGKHNSTETDMKTALREYLIDAGYSPSIATGTANNAISTIENTQIGSSDTYYEVKPYGRSGQRLITTVTGAWIPEEGESSSSESESSSEEPSVPVYPEPDTGSVSASGSASMEASIQVYKKDAVTGEFLSGAEISEGGNTQTTGDDGSVRFSGSASSSGNFTASLNYIANYDAIDPALQPQYADWFHGSREEAQAKVDSDVAGQVNGWQGSVSFHAMETKPPYGYTGNAGNQWDVTLSGGSGSHPTDSHTFENKPWEAYGKVTKYNDLTNRTGSGLSGGKFALYRESQAGSGQWEKVRDLTDNGDGTYSTGAMYYNQKKGGTFKIVEEGAPYGFYAFFTDDYAEEPAQIAPRTRNEFVFEITGENQITVKEASESADLKNPGGEKSVSSQNPHTFQASNMPWDVYVEVTKRDDFTGESGKALSGGEFTLYRETKKDSGKYEEVSKLTDNGDGTYSTGVLYYDEIQGGKYKIAETDAPRRYHEGYASAYPDLHTAASPAVKNELYFEITAGREIRVDSVNSSKNLGIVNPEGKQEASKDHPYEYQAFNMPFTTKIQLVKYDTESESSKTQGDITSLDGAEYTLYAAQRIISQYDGSTLYEEGEEVAKAVMGRSPKADEWGYLLNTDGTRHLYQPEKEIGYEDTPGTTAFYDVEPGSYMLKETKAPEGYMLDETEYSVTLSYKEDQLIPVIVRDESHGGDDNPLTVDDDPAYGGNKREDQAKIYSGDYVQKEGIQLVKLKDNDSDTELLPLDGVGFKIFRIGDLSQVKEGLLKPAEGNVWGDKDLQAFWDYDFSKEETVVLYKRDNETWTQGDKKWLEAADGGLPNQYWVKEMFTDRKGRIESPELPFGQYVVVETTTPENRVAAKPFIVTVGRDGGVRYRDETRQEIEKEFDPSEDIRYGDHEGYTEGRIPQSIRYINNKLTVSYIRIVKADSDVEQTLPGTIIKPEDLLKEQVIKEGAQYRIRAVDVTEDSRKKLLKEGWKLSQGEYLSYYDTYNRVELGTSENPFVTAYIYDEAGKIVDCGLTLPAVLPAGTYELQELTAPEGYIVSGSEEESGTIQTGEGLNGIVIEKEPSPPVQFTIDNTSVYPEEGGQMGTNKYTLCDKHGNLVVTVLQGNEEQRGIFEIYKKGEQLAEAQRLGQTLKEKLSGTDFRYIHLSEEMDLKDYQFSYELAPVEKAQFEILAAQDIYTQQIDADLAGEYGMDISRYLLYREGDVVATLTTDANGYAVAAELPIGTYKVRETVAGEGFVLNGREASFAITPQEQTVSFEWKSQSYVNERQKVRIEASKQDVETKEPVEGAVFGLYNQEDIVTRIQKGGTVKRVDSETGELKEEETQDFILSGEEQVLIPAGTLIGTAVSGEDGKAVFAGDLPHGRYEIRELEAPVGYTTIREPKDADASYDGSGQEEETRRIESLWENQKTKTVISKRDITGKEEIEGAHMQLLMVLKNPDGMDKKNPDGSYAAKLVEEWVSDREETYTYEGGVYTGHLIEGLQVGITYILRETLPAPGFVTAQDVVFVVGNENRPLVTVMEDDITKVLISKTDIVDGEEVIGAHLVIKDEQGLIVAQWDSGEEPHYIERLPVGTYTLEETLAPEGYAPNRIQFEVKDTGEIQKVAMENDVILVSIDKRETGSQLPVAGASFEIYRALEEGGRGDLVFTWTTTDGSETKEEIESGNQVEKEEIPEAVQDTKGYWVDAEFSAKARAWIDGDGTLYLLRFPAGEYILVEKEIPDGYMEQERETIFRVTPTGAAEGVQEVTVRNRPNEVTISKTDITGAGEIRGAKLSVYICDEEGEPILTEEGKYDEAYLYDSWISGDKPHIIHPREGKYILVEELAPHGFLKSQAVKFTVEKNQKEPLKVTMKDEIPEGVLTLYKYEKDQKEHGLSGAVFEIRTKEEEVLETLTTDENGHAVSTVPLPIGRLGGDGTFEGIEYQLFEVKAPEGYVLAKEPIPFQFIYEDENTVQIPLEIWADNGKTPQEPDEPGKTGENPPEPETAHVPETSEAVKEPEETKPAAPESPKTGDMENLTVLLLWGGAAGMCVMGICLLLLCRNEKKGRKAKKR